MRETRDHHATNSSHSELHDTPHKQTATPGTGAAGRAFLAALGRDAGFSARAIGRWLAEAGRALGVLLAALWAKLWSASHSGGKAGMAWAHARAGDLRDANARRRDRSAMRAERSEDPPVTAGAARNTPPAPKVPPRPRKPRPPFRPFRWLGALLLGVIAGFAVFVIGVLITLPDLDDVRGGAEDRLIFEDATGAPLMTRGTVPSAYAAFDDFPAHLREAVIAIEDRRFYEHGGLDFRAIGRAFVTNARSGGIVQGGSTLTQQLVKITYLEPSRSYRRKLHEALLTMQLEARDGKDEILTRYLNSVYLGAGATGMPAAARVYFNTDLKDLTVAQSASLAAMIQAPSVVNPFADLPALKKRAARVIDLMQAAGDLDQDEANAARAELAVMSPERPTEKYGTWFSDWVVGQADAISSSFRGVATLRTTLDPKLQKLAESAVRENLQAAGLDAEAALVALDPDGAIVAMVGGRDYETSQFNRATDAMRQPGSTFKTIVYLAALAEGYTPNDRVADRELDIDGYSPQNFDGRFRGEVTLADAFAASLNAATVKLATTIGIDRVIETARDLGITAELSKTPALALGASEVSLLEMTEAYAGIATGTIPFTARGITGISSGADGKFLRLRWPEPEETEQIQRLKAVRPQMETMLRGVVERGTGKRAALDTPVAGKTGTSQANRDALFIGWNNRLITGVWVGNDDNTPMDKITGGSLPADIWRSFMEAASAQMNGNAVAGQAQDQVPAPQSGQTTRNVQAAPNDATPARPTAEDIAEMLSRPTAETQAPSCNIQACRRSYRSFRASDCTFQPYSGPRKLCTR